MIDRRESTAGVVSESTIAEFIEDAHRLEAAVQQVIIGQQDVVRQTVVALLAGGHGLLEGVPGLGKTLLVRTLAHVLDLQFSRIQFTPDLMPADITGTTILQEEEDGRRSFRFEPGPLFANMVLADEVNRATPKTQSALLEAMQEGTVTVGRHTHALPQPFFVLATQNPLEMEGTYPLPEAQLDRFLLKILVPFPSEDVLRGIVERTLAPPTIPAPNIAGSSFNQMLQVAREVPIAGPLIDYAVTLVAATHPDRSAVITVRRYVRAGASPRGLQALITGSQVMALIEGRYNVAVSDLQALAIPALRHRVLLNFEGEAEGLTPDTIIQDVMREVAVP